MQEPRQRIGRARLIAAGVFLILLAAGIYMQFRRPTLEKTPAVVSARSSDDITRTLPLRPLGRAELIAAADEAADAYARGLATADGNDLLLDRRISLRLPFGCFGETPERAGAALSWDYDEDRQALRITARPETWRKVDWIRALAPGAEDIEGFWVGRPWMRNAVCPVGRSFIGPTLLQTPRPTLGVAELLPPGGSRVGRQVDRPYRVVKKMAPEDVQGQHGFVLVLEGRVDRFPNGQPIACWSNSPDLRPICLLAADIDHVAVQTADGKQVAEWTD